MEGWFTIALIAVFMTCVIITMDTLEKRADRHEQATVVVEAKPVEEECSSCHGLGYNDSLLLIPGGGDRRCRDCGGTGVVEAPAGDDCPACAGFGEVATGVDPQTGVALVGDCPACRGTGVMADFGGVA